MGQLPFQGAVRARRLQEVRMLEEFRIGPRGMRVELYEVWFDEETQLAWIDCFNGTFRLPQQLYAWAVAVEEQVAFVMQDDEFLPCWALFEHDEGSGEFQVEVFPKGYRTPFR